MSHSPDQQPEYTLLSAAVYFGIGILGGMAAGLAVIALAYIIDPTLWPHPSKRVFLVDSLGGGMLGLLFWWRLRLQSDWAETKRQASELTPPFRVMTTFYFPPQPDLILGEPVLIGIDHIAEAVNKLDHPADRRRAYSRAGIWAVRASMATEGFESTIWHRQSLCLCGAATAEEMYEQRATTSNHKSKGHT